MKILVVLYKFGTPEEIGKNLGSYDYFYNQLLELSKKNIEIIVLAPWLKWNKKGSKKIDSIKIIRYWPKLAAKSFRNFLLYKLINKLYIYITKIKTEKVIKREKINIVYVRQARETGFSVSKIKKNFPNIPIVFQPITTWCWHFKEAGDNLLKKIVKDIKSQKKYAKGILKDFDYFVTYNKSMIEEYVSLGAEEKKFNIIPGAVKHKIFKPLENILDIKKKLKLPLDKKIILYIGRINIKEKGIDYLLEAVKKIKDNQQDFKLIIIGPGTEEQKDKLLNIIKKLDIENFVEYLGSKDYYNLKEYINCSDIGIVPSVWFESFGRTTLDMLSCGLPVITTRVGGICETNIDNSTGLNVDSKDSIGLSKAILQIINNRELQEKFSKNARQRVLENYTLEITTNKFINFFNKII